MSVSNWPMRPPTVEEQFYIVGHTAEGTVCLLEKVDLDTEDVNERLRVWSDPKMSEPFHHDVCIALQVVTTELRRVRS